MCRTNHNGVQATHTCLLRPHQQLCLRRGTPGVRPIQCSLQLNEAQESVSHWHLAAGETLQWLSRMGTADVFPSPNGKYSCPPSGVAGVHGSQVLDTMNGVRNRTSLDDICDVMHDLVKGGTAGHLTNPNDPCMKCSSLKLRVHSHADVNRTPSSHDAAKATRVKYQRTNVSFVSPCNDWLNVYCATSDRLRICCTQCNGSHTVGRGRG